MLTLYNLNFSDIQDDTQGDTQGDTQDDTQADIEKRILSLIASNPNITTKNIAEIIGLSVVTIKRKIKTMPNVKYEGSGYSGHWVILDNCSLPYDSDGV